MRRGFCQGPWSEWVYVRGAFVQLSCSPCREFRPDQYDGSFEERQPAYSNPKINVRWPIRYAAVRPLSLVRLYGTLRNAAAVCLMKEKLS